VSESPAELPGGASATAEPVTGLRRVHPAPMRATTVGEAYDVARQRSGRPWVGVCMVSSLDGSVTIGGTSGGLGNANDLEVLLTLRRLADVVIVGAGTARGEGYGAPQEGVRIGVVTNSADVDTSSDLFRSGAGFIITSEAADLGRLARADRSGAGVEVVRAGRTRVDLAEAIDRLDTVVPGVRYVHAEGGPTLNGGLLAGDLVDELDLTIAPLMVAGHASRVAMGDAEIERRFELAHLLVDDEGYTFGRWVRRGRAVA
jgi:riboflavin biosynthesis pyrimidine reductase